jgi:DNA-binding transcriptional MerR regulator
MARRTLSRRDAADRSDVILVSRSVLCTISGISEHELALWEREDLIAPARVERTGGHVEALYDRETLRRVRVIRTLAEELEVNIAGIGVILNLLDQMAR